VTPVATNYRKTGGVRPLPLINLLKLLHFTCAGPTTRRKIRLLRALGQRRYEGRMRKPTVILRDFC
jgi:hypothetical protein